MIMKIRFTKNSCGFSATIEDSFKFGSECHCAWTEVKYFPPYQLFLSFARKTFNSLFTSFLFSFFFIPCILSTINFHNHNFSHNSEFKETVPSPGWGKQSVSPCCLRNVQQSAQVQVKECVPQIFLQINNPNLYYENIYCSIKMELTRN